ncbi:DUF2953 domain-containing protein [Bacillus atrophaeus]|uniref:DUF2953 domain-containing protein n=1 Tax=Bacillus atrophaeus TaxID=1452 RepID=UPI00227EE8BD|nr:DUF2953 domain-containing protein [Bacillus atrophaeus]MCY8826666.1 DUF2953 domain-containing protein [Bacillus atrophaeus]MCY8843206.1 DUF2953 domain-containing protein [Bacillus atrophaeus]MEC0803847.1 DUF2953 domain-containing protein [Bacillus atrophaeus]MEC0855517.1 DUF2953 domain-containing protein [Bacillus atrophaeus]MEC0858731.1 DUF2953 domain-containing protein [Bacillus atrophaeus]
MVYLLSAVLILILFVLVIRMKIQIAIEYLHSDDDDKLTVKFTSLYGLIRVKKEFPVIKLNPEDASIDVKQDTESKTKKSSGKKKLTYRELRESIDRIEMLMKQVVRMRKIGAAFLASFRVTKLEWTTIVGIKDAAATGVLTGGVWAVKGGIMGMLYEHFSFANKPVYQVIPSFQMPVSKTHLQCIFFFRFGHAMLAAFKFVRYWRGGLSVFRKKPSARLTSKNDSSV